MIPLADENPSGNKPYVVYALIIVNVLVYLVDIAGLHGPLGGALSNWSMVPWSVIHDAPASIRVPMQYGPFIRTVVVQYAGLRPEWLTIFTSMFMHGGFLHIAGNMLYLWIFGNNIEDAVGHVKFFFFYIACGVLAALAHIYSNPASVVPTVGASGAIAGVLGAYLYLYPGNSVRTLIMLGWFWDYVDIPAVFVLGVWFLMQLLNLGGSAGVQGGVAYWAHVGGFLSGIILILLLGGRGLRRPPRSYQSRYDDDRP